MSVFNTFNKNLGALGMPGGLGLLTTGVGLLEGENPLQAIQAGLGTYGSLAEDEERRRRREAIAKLGQQYAGDPRLKAIIDADPDAGLSLIAQLEANKRRPKAPTLLSQRQQLAAALKLEPGSDAYNRVLQTGSAAAPAIQTAKDADGFLRNMATGERIFPDATGKTELPQFKEFNGDLYKVTPNGLELQQEGNDDTKFMTVGDKVYRQEGNNLVEVIDQTPAAKPLSTLGKLKTDLDNGMIDKPTYDAAVAKALTTKPQDTFTFQGPDGTTFSMNGAQGQGNKLTEQQSKDLGFATRINDDLLDQLDTLDTNLASFVDQTLQKDPTGLLRSNVQNPDYQLANTLAQEFLTPLIRKDTGAAIQAWETQLYTQMFLPQPGDTEGVIERKRVARRNAVDGLRAGLPPALRVQVDPAYAELFKSYQKDLLPKGSDYRNQDLEGYVKATQASPIEAATVPEDSGNGDGGMFTATDINGMDYNDLLTFSDFDKLDLKALQEYNRRLKAGK